MMGPGGDDVDLDDNETVLRRVSEDFDIYDDNIERHRPSTQAFLQDGPDGAVSVYLSSETTPEVVASGGSEKYMVAVTVAVLRRLGLGLVRDLSSGGPGHCVITGRKTKGKLKQIIQEAEWVEGYSPE